MLPKKVPAMVRQEVANTLAKAYMAHLAGDERMPEDYTAELEACVQVLFKKKTYLCNHGISRCLFLPCGD